MKKHMLFLLLSSLYQNTQTMITKPKPVDHDVVQCGNMYLNRAYEYDINAGYICYDRSNNRLYVPFKALMEDPGSTLNQEFRRDLKRMRNDPHNEDLFDKTHKKINSYINTHAQYMTAYVLD